MQNSNFVLFYILQLLLDIISHFNLYCGNYFGKLLKSLKKCLTNIYSDSIINNVLGKNKININAELCNGSTADSDSACWGSNPYSAASVKP